MAFKKNKTKKEKLKKLTSVKMEFFLPIFFTVVSKDCFDPDGGPLTTICFFCESTLGFGLSFSIKLTILPPPGAKLLFWAVHHPKEKWAHPGDRVTTQKCLPASNGSHFGCE